jgi:hypothetical protein
MALSQSHLSYQQADLNIVKEERFVFETEWYDSQASLIRKYLLTFYPKDSTAEMVSILLIDMKGSPISSCPISFLTPTSNV